MTVVFTDLDGTLLDAATYGWEPAKPALAWLKSRRIPLVLVTSKTRAELGVLRLALDNKDPFIVENGGALFVPERYFPFELPASVQRDGFLVVELGQPYEELVTGLRAAALESDCPVLGFCDMTAQEIAECSGLSLEAAKLAKAREYDEPFLILNPGRTNVLLSTLERHGLCWTRGGRFYHVCGNNDKAQAVVQLLELYRRVHDDVRSIGLGDGPNDADFLRTVDAPVVMPSAFVDELRCSVPGCFVAQATGPVGWNEAVMALLDRAHQ